ncbi:MAG: TetR/AcrR family transcriptional regulator [Novosphingobium sp.]|uniref:TetR/AcrR family transcriptional regulator n=1 Tax=Novosphingobium sp. TaxID=1874826 RepID=UPI0012CE04A2|nr:TetR/AcrR family transcriptional regulator [Novosphingobium sp.]MPS67344.1 TetR/AcrR family transcriptional regulator [Novosphingobium sp.]
MIGVQNSWGITISLEVVMDSCGKGVNSCQVETGSPQRRIRILRRATEIFLDRGYAGATIDDIALAAGVGKVAIYQLFGDKVELFTECMIDAAKTASEGAQSVLRCDEPVRDVLVAFAEQHIRQMLRPVFGARPFYEFIRVLLSASITHPDVSGRCLAILRTEEAARLNDYFQVMIDRRTLAGGDADFLARQFMQTIFFTNVVILEPASAECYSNPRASAENAVDLFLNGCARGALRCLAVAPD